MITKHQNLQIEPYKDTRRHFEHICNTLFAVLVFEDYIVLSRSPKWLPYGMGCFMFLVMIYLLLYA